MDIISKIKSIVRSSDLSAHRQRQQISIINRSDGLTSSGLPSHVNSQIVTYPNTLLCGDGTNLPVKTTNTLLSGSSTNRNEIVYRQIADAIKKGFTPFVLSSQSKSGELYNILRTIYAENALNYIASNDSSDYYLPFLGMSQSRVADFFYQLATTLNPQATSNSMLFKRYIDVCVKVFYSSSTTVQNLINGNIDHFGLLNEITALRNNNRISPDEEIILHRTADSAQSVSVSVLSIFYDFMYKMRFSFSPKPSKFPFNCTKLTEKKCVYLHIDTLTGVHSNVPFAQCYQWYLSKTIEAEFLANASLPNQYLLIVVDNLNGTILRWFTWMLEMQSSVSLLIYNDYYSLLTDSNDLRESLAGRMDRVFFFAHINSASAEWCSKFIGERTVLKRSKITPAPSTFTDLIFPRPTIAESESEEAWYKKEEIQRLGNAGIVYCKDDFIFKKRNNFCQFQFRN